MITAKNYAAQAERDLRSSLPYYTQQGYPISAQQVAAYADSISKAVHFAIPDNGDLLDDNFKGLEGKSVRLPYDRITIEFYIPQQNTKHLILAIEAVDEKKGICIYSFIFLQSQWFPNLSGLFLPREWESEGIGILKALSEIYDKNHGPQAAIDNSRGACAGVLELLEALSCRNVSTTNHQDTSPTNAKRIKEGKLPFYETKILVIDAGYSQSKTVISGDSHASPRQHLRRGHIRRLPSGNIWVNSCIVGDATKGVIVKSYKVK